MIEQNSKQKHPEAELLVAFAEQSLTAHERETVLLHLADCAECRELLFLAQEGLPEEQPATYVAPVKATRNNWFTWRVATVAACLLLTVGVLTEQIYQRTRTTNQTVAKNIPEPQPLATTNNIVKNTSVSPAIAPPPHAPVLKGSASPNVGAAAKMPELEEAKPSLRPNFSSSAPPHAFLGTEHSFTSAGAVNLQKLQQAHATEIQSQDSSMRLATNIVSEPSTTPSATPKMAMKKVDAPAPAASASGGMTSAAPQMSRATNETVEVSASSQNLIDVERAESSKLTLLPSGQTMRESVTIAGKLLALDMSGHLYASPDQGATWHEIHKQWKGTATKLMLAPKSTVLEWVQSSGSPNTSSIEAVMLWNSMSQEWISMDGGESWKPYANKTKPTVLLDQSAPQK